jgi:uncharacterized YigZ family protein
MTHYNTIDQFGEASFKDRGSTFIGLSFPLDKVEEFKPIIQKLKKEHPKAAHFCFAYKLGIDGNKFRSSDDGEPSGSAGKPILGQIESKKLTDVLVVVVRYFGGSLLGVPGLINAYKSTAAMALQVVPTIRKPLLFKIKIEFDYTNINEISTIIKHYKCQIIAQENVLFSTYTIAIPLEIKEEVLFKLKQLRNVEVS